MWIALGFRVSAGPDFKTRREGRLSAESPPAAGTAFVMVLGQMSEGRRGSVSEL